MITRTNSSWKSSRPDTTNILGCNLKKRFYIVFIFFSRSTVDVYNIVILFTYVTVRRCDIQEHVQIPHDRLVCVHSS